MRLLCNRHMNTPLSFGATELTTEPLEDPQKMSLKNDGIIYALVNKNLQANCGRFISPHKIHS